jgi:alanine-glyoxylate transaminase/serine-glyoxylate transaminase/serine-pyruvate transaminase
VRKAIYNAGQTALFMVDTISGLASLEYQHDAWGVDVTVSGSQKGLMLAPGLSFNAASAKALAASKSSTLQRSYWDWAKMMGPIKLGISHVWGAWVAVHRRHEQLGDNCP